VIIDVKIKIELESKIRYNTKYAYFIRLIIETSKIHYRTKLPQNLTRVIIDFLIQKHEVKVKV